MSGQESTEPSTGSKRPLEDADPGIEPATKSRGQQDATDLEDTPIDKRQPYEYICMAKPYYASEVESDDEDEEEPEDESESSMFNKLAAKHPEWPYTIMAESWRRLCDWTRRSSYCNPDLFSMYIYNDFHGYGILELLENLIIEFNGAFEEKDTDKMWSIVATLAHWLNHGSSQAWMGVEDSERAGNTLQVVGIALLTALHQLDRAGELKQDSKFRDLGLVMALCLQIGASSPIDYMEWVPKLISYAKKAGVDLAKQGVDGLEKVLEQEAGDGPLRKSSSEDRWKWTQKFKALEPVGGDEFNILRMPRMERAKLAFDKKDPLNDFSDKDLREGNLMVS